MRTCVLDLGLLHYSVTLELYSGFEKVVNRVLADIIIKAMSKYFSSFILQAETNSMILTHI